MTSTTRRCRPIPALDEALHALPGRKLVFTNGTVAHAEKVLARLGVTHHFGDIFDIVHSDFIPKPEIGALSQIRRADRHRAAKRRRCSRTSPAISKRRTRSA